MEDRRTFQRFDARYPVKFKDTRKGFGEEVILRDASAQGVRIKCKDRYFINDHLALEVELPGGRDPMDLRGKVVWVSKDPQNHWDIGLEFHEIDLFGMARMFKYVDFPS